MILSRGTISIFLLFISSFACCSSAIGNSYSLILAEIGKDSNGEQTQTLVRYSFHDGEMVSKEPILTKKTEELRFEFGSRIYQNRYIITYSGNTIDLASGQLVLKSNGHLLHIDGDIVAIKVDRSDEEGIFEFNLRSHKYSRIKKGDFWLEPSFMCFDSQMSPNGQIRAISCNDGIWFRYLTGRKQKLSGKFGHEGTVECSDMYHPIFLWVDNNRLLTQLRNSHLVLASIDDKVEPLVMLPDFKPAPCGPRLRRDGDNKIYYETSDQAWLIDVNKRTFEKYLWEALGNGFDIEFNRNPLHGHRIRYRNEEIGRYWCDSAHTISGHIALAFGPVGSNLGYPKGVLVWSSENHRWTTIEVDFLAGIVGWVKE